ncbi:MAG: hypothetical protein JETCAE03_33810 [Ignavibacteriaceae bacterium]|jgi:hypothetical protein|nr:MAG: hypothetical protein JETCAE03_33810 [Ignavibacteriaceae bacterium]
MPKLKLRTFLREYSGTTATFNSIKFQILIKIDSEYCKIQYIPKSNNELVKIEKIYGKEKVAKKIQSHIANIFGVTPLENSQDAGFSFTIRTSSIENHILQMLL